MVTFLRLGSIRQTPSIALLFACAVTLVSSSNEYEATCKDLLRSTKLAPHCHEEAGEEPPVVYPLLITGTPRAGTSATASALRSLGLDISADNAQVDILTGKARSQNTPGKQGASSWPFTFADDDANYPNWAGSLHHGRFRVILHQVRNPLEVISSIASSFHFPPNHPTFRFIERHLHLPGLETKTDYKLSLLRALYLWLEWTDFLEKVADWTFRFEDLDPWEICQRAGIGSNVTREHAAEAVADIRRKHQVVDHHHTSLTWEVLFAIDKTLASLAKDMACQLGYDCSVQVRRDASGLALTDYRPFNVGICSRIRNEAKYLREWIEFHRMVGVGRFYIWYDESDDNTLEILKHYADRGIVRIFDITTLPGHEPGMQPYDHAERSFRDACLQGNPDNVLWLMFIDADEYVFPRDADNLAEFITSHCSPNVSHISVQSSFFGTSGRATTPEGMLTIEAYTGYDPMVKAKDGQRAVYKVIANTRCVTAMATHYPTKVTPADDCKIIYNKGEALQHVMERSDFDDLWQYEEHQRCGAQLQLNHYVTRSRQDFIDKYRKGKLSQSRREQQMGVDREAFVKRYGGEFVKHGMNAVLKRFMIDNGYIPRATIEDPINMAYLRFHHEFANKNGGKLNDTTITRFVPDLKQRLKKQHHMHLLENEAEA